MCFYYHTAIKDKENLALIIYNAVVCHHGLNFNFSKRLRRNVHKAGCIHGAFPIA